MNRLARSGLAAFAAFVTTLVAPVHAGEFEAVASPEPVVAPVISSPAPTPDLMFRIGGGLSYAPDYFGSKDSSVGPAGGLAFRFLRLPGNITFGSPSEEPKTGFGPRGSFRIIGARSADDNAELRGLEDVPLSVEIGMGLGYTTRNFDAFAAVRYGALGHHSFVGELGADVILRPSDRLTLSAGPRVLLGSRRYANTYFGVTAAESLASGGRLAQFDAKGGAMTAGVQMAADYKLNDLWSVEGALRYDRFLGDNRNSPILRQGREDDLRVSVGITRLISLDF